MFAVSKRTFPVERAQNSTIAELFAIGIARSRFLSPGYLLPEFLWRRSWAFADVAVLQ
jgi:hypothetical protein